MDRLFYHYQATSNRLDYVQDTVPAANYAADIDGQNPGNYRYDSIGNLTKDVKNGVDSIYWNVYGKITKVVKKDTSINYAYDAAGNRISKTVVKPTATITTWFVRDAGGIL